MSRKDRTTTLQQKLGFQDDSLETPMHDNIMVWLDGAVEDIIKEFLAQESEHPFTISSFDKVWESPVMSGDYIVGFLDMKVVAHIGEGTRTFLFEVKPLILSAGELIRQIRMYQQYEKGTYFVVSMDERYTAVLKGQGIQFAKVSPSVQITW